MTYIWVVGLVYVTALCASGWMAPLSARDLLIFAVVFACGTATVELTKRAGENAGHTKDVYGVWDLPLAILLPPVYVLAVQILRGVYFQYRVRRIPWHRRVFTAASIGLAYASVSVGFHALMHGHKLLSLPGAGGDAVWVLAVAGAAVLQWVLNTSLVMVPIKGADPAAGRIREIVFDRGKVHNDVTEICVAVLVALGIAVTPVTIAFAFPFVILLQRSSRHEQLVSASRLDTKTGLLNAGTWEREAALEVARGVRTKTQLALAIVDLDNFKQVNDKYGHLVGDKCLQAVSRVLQEFVREYDLVGRFGGEEFAILLPQAGPVDAYAIAERIRAYIGTMPIEVSTKLTGEPFTVTVSVGVAALGATWDTRVGGELTDLLAAADMALYQAKKNGRDQVCVITENTTFGTHEQREFAPPQ